MNGVCKLDMEKTEGRSDGDSSLTYHKGKNKEVWQYPTSDSERSASFQMLMAKTKGNLFISAF